MRRHLPAGALASVLALALLAGCDAETPLPTACQRAAADDVLAALRGAPDDATLADGTTLSTCVDLAEDDAQLQGLGVALVGAADRLAGALDDDRRAAWQLGFLIGAAERGAGPTGGTQAELLRRIEQPVAFRALPTDTVAAVRRGIAAGRRVG